MVNAYGEKNRAVMNPTAYYLVTIIICRDGVSWHQEKYATSFDDNIMPDGADNWFREEECRAFWIAMLPNSANVIECDIDIAAVESIHGINAGNP